MKKLEQTLQYLQKKEEALWFWGVQRSDDPNLATELLADVGLKLDRRDEFPRKRGEIAAVQLQPHVCQQLGSQVGVVTALHPPEPQGLFLL
ncbi:MAG TPA: hypothetical protein VKG84_06855, partial [Candidatus Acidoferrales bacterium]|nr:hypothetical protein [Candidatus Acidoferrales bacterium]